MKTGLFPDSWHHAMLCLFLNLVRIRVSVWITGPSSSLGVGLRTSFWKQWLTCGWLSSCRRMHVLTPNQSNSQVGRLMLDPLTCLEDTVCRSFEHQPLTVAVLFDIQKAYDTNWCYCTLFSRCYVIVGFEVNSPHSLLAELAKHMWNLLALILFTWMMGPTRKCFELHPPCTGDFTNCSGLLGAE